MDRRDTGQPRVPVALVGKVFCFADATGDAIRVGDLLTTGDRRGHAQRIVDGERAFGAVLGKALAPLPTGTGLDPRPGGAPMTVRLRDIAESEGTPPRALALADALDIPSQPGASASVRELLRVGSVPRFRPERWNDDRGVRYNNNCYNYGTDVLNGTFARPGFASGVTDEDHPPLDCALATTGAIADGLISTGSEPSLADVEFGHVAALVIAPGQDFHWYRRGRDGMWSHKPGGSGATSRDGSGNPITDPGPPTAA